MLEAEGVSITAGVPTIYGQLLQVRFSPAVYRRLLGVLVHAASQPATRASGSPVSGRPDAPSDGLSAPE